MQCLHGSGARIGSCPPQAECAESYGQTRGKHATTVQGSTRGIGGFLGNWRARAAARAELLNHCERSDGKEARICELGSLWRLERWRSILRVDPNQPDKCDEAATGMVLSLRQQWIPLWIKPARSRWRNVPLRQE